MNKREIVDELHKQARKNFKRRRVIIKRIDDLWQADLVEMGIPFSIDNYRHIFKVRLEYRTQDENICRSYKSYE